MEPNPYGSTLVTSYGWYDTFLLPLKWLVAWVLVIIHHALVFLGMPDGPGLAWVLSIVLMTVALRFAIFPLFTKQIRSQRAMQALAPEMRKIQARYKGKNDTVSKQRQQQEILALYKEHGTSPFASCLPILVQIPIFAALFRVLAATAGIETGTYPRPSIGPLDKAAAIDINRTQIFGATMIENYGSALTNQSKIVIATMIAIMVLTQFLTMRQISVKNMPASALEGPQARMQKTMMYVMPLFIGFTGILFQVGLLIYMLTTNFFTMFQQIWAIKTMPTPGSEAYKKWHVKQKAKYDAFFAQTMADYEKKFEENRYVQVTDEQREKQREDLIKERDELLRKQRVKLGLEDKRKAARDAAAQLEAQTGPRVQPTRLSRAERKSLALKDDSDNSESTDNEVLSDEEIARRRAERRAEQRARKARLREAKEKARQKRIREQGRRPGDMNLD
ncbi:membrane protein insertase YidC [Actinomycetaceae bacterium TAE3-ERU4]|nr:membrane protein insertase YidC [Actinomycetaceae bacterium TAE3-ERU4]